MSFPVNKEEKNISPTKTSGCGEKKNALKSVFKLNIFVFFESSVLMQHC